MSLSDVFIKQNKKCANSPSLLLQELNDYGCRVWAKNDGIIKKFEDVRFFTKNGIMYILCRKCYNVIKSRARRKNKLLKIKVQGSDYDPELTTDSEDSGPDERDRLVQKVNRGELEFQLLQKGIKPSTGIAVLQAKLPEQKAPLKKEIIEVDVIDVIKHNDKKEEIKINVVSQGEPIVNPPSPEMPVLTITKPQGEPIVNPLSPEMPSSSLSLRRSSLSSVENLKALKILIDEIPNASPRKIPQGERRGSLAIMAASRRNSISIDPAPEGVDTLADPENTDYGYEYPVEGENESTCAECFTKLNERQYAMVPCGHTRICEACAKKVKKCPVCSGETTSFIRIFF